MQAVAIVGAGELGATVARAVTAHQSADEVRLIDESGTVAAGKALDLWQAGAVDGSVTRVIGGTDLARVSGARVVVMADRASGGEWEGDAALELVRRVVTGAPGAPLVFAGARQQSLLALAARELRVPRTRLVGTAPEALVSAARALTALLSDSSPADVTVPVLGAAPRWVFAWSEAQAGGVPLEHALGAAELIQLEARVRACWPPGTYALGSAAARAVHALLRGSLHRFTICTALDGEYGVRGVVAAVPARLAPGGVQQVFTAPLNVREQVAFQSSLQSR